MSVVEAAYHFFTQNINTQTTTWQQSKYQSNNQLFRLNWVQTVCKSYKQTTLVDTELKNLVLFLFDLNNGHPPSKIVIQPVEKIKYDPNSSTRLKNIKRHETELKWIKFLQSPFPLGFNDNIYHEGNISKMPDFDVFSVLECKKRKSRSHGKRKNGNIKRKMCTEKRLNTSLKDLSLALTNHGRHGLFSFLSSLPISVLRNLELDANKLYDRANKLYKAALLTRCYVQHFLSPYIDSEVNHKRHFIKFPFINKGIEFIDLHSIFKDNSVISSIPNYFNNSETPIICYKYNKPIRSTIFNFNKIVNDLDIDSNTPAS